MYAVIPVQKVYYYEKTLLLLASLFLCITIFTTRHQTEAPKDPDVYSSSNLNGNLNLIIIANRDEISDPQAFANQLIKMCKENTFKSVRFSYDIEIPASLSISVYLQVGDVHSQEPVLKIDYKPNKHESRCNILDDSNDYTLFLNGKAK